MYDWMARWLKSQGKAKCPLDLISAIKCWCYNELVHARTNEINTILGFIERKWHKSWRWYFLDTSHTKRRLFFSCISMYMPRCYSWPTVTGWCPYCLFAFRPESWAQDGRITPPYIFISSQFWSVAKWSTDVQSHGNV